MMPTNFTLNFLTVTKRIFCSRSLQLATIELIRRKAVLQMTDKTDQIKGKVQETVGKVTDDQQLEAKGKAEEIKGKASEKADDLGDTIKEKTGELKDKVAGVFNKLVDKVDGKD